MYLEQGMAVSKEIYEARNDPAVNNTLDWRVLFLRQKFAEFSCRVKLAVWIFRKDTCDHFLSQLIK